MKASLATIFAILGAGEEIETPPHQRPMQPFLELLDQVSEEAGRQDARYGWQSKLDLLGRPHGQLQLAWLSAAEKLSRARQEKGHTSLLDLLIEELSEAAREPDPAKRAAELVQLATLVLGWAQAELHPGVDTITASSPEALTIHVPLRPYSTTSEAFVTTRAPDFMVCTCGWKGKLYTSAWICPRCNTRGEEMSPGWYRTSKPEVVS